MGKIHIYLTIHIPNSSPPPPPRRSVNETHMYMWEMTDSNESSHAVRYFIDWGIFGNASI